MNYLEQTKPDWALTRRDRKRLARQAAGTPPPSRRWLWIALVAVAVLAIGVLAWTRFSAAPPPAEPATSEAAAMRLHPIDVVTVAPQALADTVKVAGSLLPRRQIQLTSQVAGKVVEVKVRVGDVVAAGGVVMQLDTESILIQLEQQRSTAAATKAQLVLAESQLARTEQLAGQGLAPAASLDSGHANADALRANLAALTAQVAAAEINLRNATVTAPFGGVIASRLVEPGQSLAVGTPIAQLVDLGRLELTANVPVRLSAAIARDQAVELTVEGVAGRSFDARVDSVSPVAAEGTRSIPVHIALENTDHALRGGMFATGQIVVHQAADVLAVPVTAIRTDDAGAFVLKLVDGHLVRQDVKPGRNWSGGRLVEIDAGLAAGDLVLGATLEKLQPGVAVELAER